MLSREGFFRRRIVIDEEGFPMIDGLRIEDEDSLRDIFSNLRKQDTKLVSTWAGSELSVEAFSSPFIIQSVDQIGPKEFHAHIFAGLVFDFKESELQIDEWGRLHLYLGPDKIEATFSCKAQSQFFMYLDREIRFATFRSAEARVSGAEHWQSVYKDKTDGWDIGEVSPSLKDLAQTWVCKDDAPLRILIPGAGRGYEAEWLAKLGHEVVAEDFADAAKLEFDRLNPGSKVLYQTQDFFKSRPEELFDVVLELIFFCAIDPARRREYFERCYERLKPGALLVGIYLMHHGPGGPPFSTTQWELREYTKDLFKVRHWQTSQHSIEPRLGKEFAVVLQKPLQ
jgi:SAM-dependent methyltransferase